MKTSSRKKYRLLCTFVYIIIATGCTKNDLANNGGETIPEGKFQPMEVENYWWPAQKCPKSYTIITHNNSIQEQMLAQSVIGIAAQCVNRGISTEMVWEYTDNPLQKRALQEISTRLRIQRRGTVNIWEVIKRLVKEGVIKGYVTYSLSLKGCANNYDDNAESLNAATMIAGLDRVVLIDESIERSALEAGLTKIADATKTTPLKVFEENKHLLNNKFTYMADPAYTAGRDLVIAQCATILHHPKQSYTQQIIKWLEPLAPVIGVTCADEAETVLLSSKYSHFHIGLDHSNNFTFLSIEAFNAPIDKMKALDPTTLNYSSTDAYHSVFISDGDNLGWIHDYLSGDKGGWLNPAGDNTSLSWTFTPINMSASSPSGWNYYVETKKDNCSLIEYGLYMYPDIFATEMPDQREQLLRQLAKRIEAQMKKTGTNILSFICIDSHSPQTMDAYKIFVQEIECLIGCISIQYFPYPDGKGDIDWVARKDGVEIPIIRPKYCIVGGDQGDVYGKYQGTPSEIFLKVNADENKLTSTVYHAWSTFTQLPDGHLGSTATPPALGTMNAVNWAKQLLNPTTHLVSYEELVWRIRMKHRPEQTKRLLKL